MLRTENVLRLTAVITRGATLTNTGLLSANTRACEQQRDTHQKYARLRNASKVGVEIPDWSIASFSDNFTAGDNTPVEGSSCNRGRGDDKREVRHNTRRTTPNMLGAHMKHVEYVAYKRPSGPMLNDPTAELLFGS